MACRDYEEFIAALNGHGVRYLLIGAHAVAFHARSRATKDLDILYWIPLRGTPAGPWRQCETSSGVQSGVHGCGFDRPTVDHSTRSGTHSNRLALSHARMFKFSGGMEEPRPGPIWLRQGVLSRTRRLDPSEGSRGQAPGSGRCSRASAGSANSAFPPTLPLGTARRDDIRRAYVACPVPRSTCSHTVRRALGPGTESG